MDTQVYGNLGNMAGGLTAITSRAVQKKQDGSSDTSYSIVPVHKVSGPVNGVNHPSWKISELLLGLARLFTYETERQRSSFHGDKNTNSMFTLSRSVKKHE